MKSPRYLLQLKIVVSFLIILCCMLSTVFAYQSFKTQDIPFEEVTKVSYSDVKTQKNIVINDSASFAALWKELFPYGNPPSIDFTQRTVLALFMGTKPTGGYAITVQRIQLNADTLSVFYTNRVPQPHEIVTSAFTYPLHVVSIPKITLPVLFKDVPFHTDDIEIVLYSSDGATVNTIRSTFSVFEKKWKEYGMDISPLLRRDCVSKMEIRPIYPRNDTGCCYINDIKVINFSGGMMLDNFESYQTGTIDNNGNLSTTDHTWSCRWDNDGSKCYATIEKDENKYLKLWYFNSAGNPITSYMQLQFSGSTGVQDWSQYTYLSFLIKNDKIIDITEIKHRVKPLSPKVIIKKVNNRTLLSFDNINGVNSVLLYTLQGKLIYSGKIEQLSTTRQFYFPHLPNGMYLFQLNSNQGIFRGQVLLR